MTKFTADQIARLIRLYTDQPLTIDKLPYTDEMNKMVDDFNTGDLAVSHWEIYNKLMTFRKKGWLPVKWKVCS